MSYALKAALSSLVGIGALVAVLALGSGTADLAGFAIVAASLVVFMRAVLSLAGESGERPPPPSGEPR
jgi:hypothetical protein